MHLYIVIDNNNKQKWPSLNCWSNLCMLTQHSDITEDYGPLQI